MTAKKFKRLLSNQNTKAFLIISLVLLVIYLVPIGLGRNQNPILQRADLSSVVIPGHTSGQYTIDPNDGFTSQAIGHLAAKSWLSGHIPYWNYYEGIGEPLAGGMQSSALFPLILVQYFGDGIVYFHFLLGIIAGFVTYVFLRRLKLSFWIAVTGGVLFELTGTFVWLTNAAFNPIVFLPLLLVGIEYAFSYAQDHKKNGWTLIAIALGLSLYAGFPETAVIDAVFAYGWAIFRLLQLKKNIRKPYIFKLLTGSIIGLLLAAPVLIAFLDYLPYATTGAHGVGGFSKVGLPISTFPALFMPYIFGPIFGYVTNNMPTNLFLFWSNVGGYITIPLVLVALFGLFSKRERSLKIYLSLATLLIIFRVYNFKPVSWLVNLIPGTDQIAIYRYSIPALSLAIIILAMFGLEAIAKRQISRVKVIGITILLAIFAGVLALYSRGLLHQLKSYPNHRLWAIFSVCLAMSILFVIVLSFVNVKVRLKGVALLLVANSFILFVIPYLSIPKTTNIDYAPVSYLQKNIGLSRFYTLGPIEPNYGSYFNVASINVNDLPVAKNWTNYISKYLDSNSVPIVFTGYTRADAAGPTALQEFSKNLAQYENVGVKYLVTAHNQINSTYSNANGINLVFKDNLVDIYKLPETKPFYQDSSNDCSITNQTLSTLTVDCITNANIIRQELYMPGWSASVNNVRQSVKPNQVIFEEVSVHRGKSTIRFAFNPPFIGIAYIVLALGLLALLFPAKHYFFRIVKLK